MRQVISSKRHALSAKDRAIHTLAERNEELELVILAMLAGRNLPSGVVLPKVPLPDGVRIAI